MKSYRTEKRYREDQHVGWFMIFIMVGFLGLDVLLAVTGLKDGYPWPVVLVVCGWFGVLIVWMFSSILDLMVNG